MNDHDNDGENQVEVEVEVVQEEKELSDIERVQKIQSVFSQWNLLTQGLRPQIAPLLTRIQEQRLTQNENLNGTVLTHILISYFLLSNTVLLVYFYLLVSFYLNFYFYT
jgi:hypothetical protein